MSLPDEKPLLRFPIRMPAKSGVPEPLITNS